MYYNVFGEKVSKRRFKEMEKAAKNRRELIAAGLTSRRDLFKMGLLTAGGMLVAKSGLRAPAYAQSGGGNISPGSQQLRIPGNQAQRPTTNPFIDPLPIMPSTTRQTTDHGHFSGFHGLPVQTIWGFDDGTGTRTPGPTYQAFYGQPELTRNHNSLPATNEVNNTGFGMPQVSTHLHNAHNPSESDVNLCDFYPNENFCNQYYPNALNGDINESLDTLWYHDHRADFTSQNTYKGLAGFYCLFNQFDTGDEGTGFHLPSFPQFDIPLAFADSGYDPSSGQLVFDLLNLDGILGDKFPMNGMIQPFLQVSPRRYRFCLLDTGLSRFYEFFLTDLTNLSTINPFWLISTDGNLIPTPVQVTSVRIGPADRVDIIIDFTNLAGKTLYLENRLNQLNGQGPTRVDSHLFPQNSKTIECTLANPIGNGAILNAGQGNLVLQFRVTGPQAADSSVDPSTRQTFYQLPSTNIDPCITRTFKFGRLNGQLLINDQFNAVKLLPHKVETGAPRPIESLRRKFEPSSLFMQPDHGMKASDDADIFLSSVDQERIRSVEHLLTQLIEKVAHMSNDELNCFYPGSSFSHRAYVSALARTAESKYVNNGLVSPPHVRSALSTPFTRFNEQPVLVFSEPNDEEIFLPTDVKKPGSRIRACLNSNPQIPIEGRCEGSGRSSIVKDRKNQKVEAKDKSSSGAQPNA